MKKLLTIALFIFSIASAYSKEYKPENRLLWKISGKGLKKPSYLYGTMHVTNEQVFNLSDSAVAAFRNCEIFATEVDFITTMQELFQTLYHKDSVNYIKGKLTKKQYEELDKRFITATGVSLDNVNTRELWSIEHFLGDTKDLKMDSAYIYVAQKHRETFLDAYLFALAASLNKKTTGLEYLNDYRTIYNTLNGAQLFIDKMKKKAAVGDHPYQYSDFLNLYTSGDVDSMYVLTEELRWSGLKELKLRNLNISRRIDSIIQTGQGLFSAVGAAHLVGDSGLVKLLKNRGYTVTAVKATHSGKKEFKLPPYTGWNYKWQTFVGPDSSYALSVPIKPIELPGMQDYGMEANAYFIFDIFSKNTFYIINMTPGMIISPEKEETILREFAKNVIRNKGETIYKSNYNSKATPHRLELYTTRFSNKNYSRYNVYLNNNQLIIICHSGTKEGIAGGKVEPFFSSLAVYDKTGKQNRKEAAYTLYKSAEGAYQSLQPSNSKEFVKKEDNDYGKIITLYYNNTPVNGNIYLSGYERLPIDDYIQNDTAYLQESYDKLLYNEKWQEITSKDTIRDGHQSKYFENKRSDSTYRKGFLIVRNNRLYYHMLSGSKESVNNANANQFISSFKLLPYAKTQFFRYVAEDSSFSINLPQEPRVDSTLKVDPYDTPRELDEIALYTQDPNTSDAYHMTVASISPYIETSDPFPYLDSLKFTDSTNKIIRDTHVTKNGIKARELIYTLKGNKCEYMWLTVNNQKLYMTGAAIETKEYTDDRFKQYFSSIQFRKDKKYTGDRSLKLLTDLASTDSVTAERSYNSISLVTFKQKHFPEFKKALANTYAIDSSRAFYTTKRALLDQLVHCRIKGKYDFIKEVYLKTTDTTLQMDILHTCEGTLNDTTVKLFKELLIKNTPKKKYVSMYEFAGMRDSVYIKQLYPEIYQLLKKPTYRSFVVYFTTETLRDSITGGSILKGYEKELLAAVRSEVFTEKSDSSSEWYNSAYTSTYLLQQIGNDSAVAMLHELTRSPLINDKYWSCLRLTEMGFSLPQALYNEVAADINYRFGFWQRLTSMHKGNLFPKKYLTQESIAMANLAEFTSYDSDAMVERMEVIKIQKYKYNGKKHRVYVIKFKLKNDNNWYVGISGLHPLEKDKISDKFDFTTTNYQTLESQKINDHFKTLIENTNYDYAETGN